jgi:hypothetical protein
MFEITMLDGSIIVWGASYRPDALSVSLSADAQSVNIVGRLSDRNGPVVSFDLGMQIDASFEVDTGGESVRAHRPAPSPFD